MRRGKFVKIGAADRVERFLGWFFFNAERKISAEGQHGINVEVVEILRVIVYDRQ